MKARSWPDTANVAGRAVAPCAGLATAAAVTRAAEIAKQTAARPRASFAVTLHGASIELAWTGMRT
jgi:hypothetical protein